MAKDEDALATMLGRLEKEVCSTGIDLEVEQVFRHDLLEVMRIRTSSDEFKWAPYIQKYDTKTYRLDAQASVNFPNLEHDLLGMSVNADRTLNTVTSGPSLTVLVRCLDSEGKASYWYSVPIIIDEKVALDASGVLERPIGRVRLGEHLLNDLDRLANDELTSIIKKMHRRKKLTRSDQDLYVNMDVRKLLRAYEREESMKFKGTQVQKVTVVMPVNPGVYRTEMVGLVYQRKDHWSKDMCFGYGAGNVFYRGRPVVSSPEKPRFLMDSDKAGKDCYFAVESLSAVTEAAQSGAVVKDVYTGNFLVIAMPLVGEEPQEVDIKPQTQSQVLFQSDVKISIDIAALSTGLQSGTTSQLVARSYDTRRKLGIMDARLLTLGPDKRTPDAIKTVYAN